MGLHQPFLIVHSSRNPKFLVTCVAAYRFGFMASDHPVN